MLNTTALQEGCYPLDLEIVQLIFIIVCKLVENSLEACKRINVLPNCGNGRDYESHVCACCIGETPLTFCVIMP